MKAFFASVLVAVVIASASYFVLQSQQRSAATAFTTTGARVGDAGTNLIGVN